MPGRSGPFRPDARVSWEHARVSSGSIEEANKSHHVLAGVLVGVIVVCAVVLGFNNLGRPLTRFVLTVSSAVAGAALGNFLRVDLTQNRSPTRRDRPRGICSIKCEGCVPGCQG